MRYQLTPIYCRPWLVAYLSIKLIESHYENDYGAALRRLNAIAEKLESLDFANAPDYAINGLKREELLALNATLLHELYFASLGGNGGKPTGVMAEALARDFGSVERWQDEFIAMGNALGGGAGWVLLTYIPRDRRLINQYASDDSQAVAEAFPSWRSTCTSTPITWISARMRWPMSGCSCAISTGRRCRHAIRMRRRSSRRGLRSSPRPPIGPGSAWRKRRPGWMPPGTITARRSGA